MTFVDGVVSTGSSTYTEEDSWNTLQEEWTKLIEKERGSK